MVYCRALVIVVSVALLCHGAIYDNPSQLKKTTYDYIVIGSGAGGSVVASRLSEDQNVDVLLVEAGVSGDDVLASQIPLLAPTLAPDTVYDWNYTTTPQPGYGNRVLNYLRGRALGGSTFLNYATYSRGASADFDKYASLTGDDGWSWDNMLQYAFKNEKLVHPADHHDTSGQFIPSHHSRTGAVSISLPGFPTPLDSHVLQTTRQLRDQFPFNPDMIGGNVLGIGWIFSSIGNGTRSSSATAYLPPAVISSRSNLDIVLNAQATKLLKTGTVRGLPSFHGVTVQQNQGAPPRNLIARHEIIVSAGSFGTPALLQLSGIGDRDTLKAAGITPIVHNPSVGRNLSDHALVPLPFAVSETQTFERILGQDFESNLRRWRTSRTGPLANGFANHFGWLRLPKNSPIFKSISDPATGRTSAHYEVIFINGWVVPGVPPPTGHFMTAVAALTSPTSRGSVHVTSPDPFTPPSIDPSWLTTPFDIFTLIHAFKSTRAFMAASAWKGYITKPAGNLTSVATTDDDTKIEDYVRKNAAPFYHALGTASMSPKGASWGVVDPDLRVKNVEGLRIVDGSVIPLMPSAHPQGPIYMFGERGAALIKASRNINILRCQRKTLS